MSGILHHIGWGIEVYRWVGIPGASKRIKVKRMLLSRILWLTPAEFSLGILALMWNPDYNTLRDDIQIFVGWLYREWRLRVGKGEGHKSWGMIPTEFHPSGPWITSVLGRDSLVRKITRPGKRKSWSWSTRYVGYLLLGKMPRKVRGWEIPQTGREQIAGFFFTKQ